MLKQLPNYFIIQFAFLDWDYATERSRDKEQKIADERVLMYNQSKKEQINKHHTVEINLQYSLPPADCEGPS